MADSCRGRRTVGRQQRHCPYPRPTFSIPPTNANPYQRPGSGSACRLWPAVLVIDSPPSIPLQPNEPRGLAEATVRETRAHQPLRTDAQRLRNFVSNSGEIYTSVGTRSARHVRSWSPQPCRHDRSGHGEPSSPACQRQCRDFLPHQQGWPSTRTNSTGSEVNERRRRAGRCS